jgi:hypothetical protein
MNTNYSKIALLLALGVVAGNGVSAKISVDFYPKNRASFDKANLDTMASDIARKKNDILKSDPITDSLVQHLKAFDTDASGELVLKGARGGTALTLSQMTSDTDLQDLLKEINDGRKSEKSAVKAAISVFEGLTTDVKNLNNSGSSLTTLFTSKGKPDQVKSLVDLVNNTSNATIDDTVIRGVSGVKFTSKYKVLPTDKLLISLAGAKKALSDAVKNVPASIEMTDSSSVKSTYDMTKVKEAIENFANFTVSKFAEASLNLQPININQLQSIKDLSRQASAYKELVSQLNFLSKAGYDKLANKVIAVKGLKEWFASVATAKKDFEQSAPLILTTATPTGANKGGAVRIFLNTVFDENANLDGSNAATVFNTGEASNNGVGTSFVNDTIMAAIGFVADTATDSKFKNDSDKSISTNSANNGSATYGEDLFRRWFGLVVTALNSSGIKTSKKEANINAFNEFLNAKSSSAAVEFTKGISEASHSDVTDYFNKILNYVDNNKTLPSFAGTAKITKEMADKVWAGVEEIYTKEKKDLIGSYAKSQSKMFKDFNSESLDSSYAQIKALYEKVVKGLNVSATATESAAPKASEAKTIADLENSAEFKAKTLKVSAISEDLKKIISDEKDSVKAKALYEKLFANLITDQTTKAPSEADAAALRKLFAEDVQKDLSVPSSNQVPLASEGPKQDDNKGTEKVAKKVEEPKNKDSKTGQTDDDTNVEEESDWLEALDLAFLNPKTGALVAKQKEALETLTAAFEKKIAEFKKGLKGDKPAVANKKTVAFVKESAQKLAEKFREEAYDAGEEEENADAEAAATKKVIAAITPRLEVLAGLKQPAKQSRTNRRLVRNLKRVGNPGTGRTSTMQRLKKEAQGTKPKTKTNRGRGRSRSRGSK